MQSWEVNRRHWDALAAVHGEGRDTYYDVEALLAGGSTLHEAEARAVDIAVSCVEGLDVMHLQCHLAFDAISLARRGARVTGVDSSPASLAKARDIAARCGVDLELVEANSMALPATVDDRFDLVYASIGVLSYIADVDAWMRSVARSLRTGGRLALVEIHPLLAMVATRDPLVLDFPYAFDGARRFDEDGSYADRDAHVEATETLEFGHSLGEIVTAAVDASLTVERLDEHLDADFDPRGDVLARDHDGRYRLRLVGEETLPVLFTLIARRD